MNCLRLGGDLGLNRGDASGITITVVGNRHDGPITQSVGAVEYTDCTSGYDTKQSDGEIPAVLELWGMQSTPSLPSLPGPLWPRVVAPDRVLSMG